MENSRRLTWLRAHMCPQCPLQRTCPQFTEQLLACADARRIQREDEAEAKKEEKEG